MHLAIDARLFSSQFTGIGRYTHEICKQLFVLRPQWKYTLFLEPGEYKKFTPPSSNITAICAPEKIYTAKEQIHFLHALNKVNADVYWFPHFTVPYFFRKKYVVTLHDLTLSKFPGKKMNSWLHRMVYFAILRNAIQKSEHIITVSQNTKKDLMTDENVPSKKISITYNAVGKEFLDYTLPSDSSKRLEDLGITMPFFLYTGQHRQHKNLITMAKGFHSFVQKNGGDFQLVVTGKKNPLYPEFWDYCMQHSLQKNIIMPGLVSEADLLLLYKKSSAYIFPSLYEGFGIPPLESMAMETPVIASHSSSIPEVCGDAALFFNPYNSDELAEKMELLVHSPQIQQEYIEKGKKRVKYFSWEESAKNIIKVFEQSV